MDVDAESKFSLRCELVAHSKDVRSIAEGDVKGISTILSCSRDYSLRFWSENISDRENPTYESTRHITGYQKFPTAVAFMNSNRNNKEGYAFCANLDSTIYAYNTENESANYQLKGHTDQVICLAVDTKRGLLISGSVDKTVRIWRAESCISVLTGHQHIVWAVAVIKFGKYDETDGASSLPAVLSGSADKTVILWINEKPARTFLGHTDVVRSVVDLNEAEFLSAANDCTIRRWCKEDGVCSMIYHSENYIYSLSYQDPYDFFVSGGEDKCLRIWNIHDDSCRQTIKMPALSVWSVAVLRNGDVACGSSDGAIRIFSRHPSRRADPDLLRLFEHTVADFNNVVESKDEIGGVKIADLPGPESLLEPGRRDGQTKMIRVTAAAAAASSAAAAAASTNGGPSGSVRSAAGATATSTPATTTSVELHSWSANDQKWIKIGDVLGEKKDPAAQTENGLSTSGKKIYEGKEYDLIFDVDVEDGKPKLKLPYNLTDDPWVAAQQFIHKNFLPQAYLETVANFIIKNAASAAGAPAHKRQETYASSYADPLTGCNRYVPKVDNVNSSSSVVDYKRPKGENMPLPTYITFPSAASNLLVKLKENNESIIDAGLKLTEDEIIEVQHLVNTKECRNSEKIMSFVGKILQWPKNLIVPGLDALRLALLTEPVLKAVFGRDKSYALEFLDKLCGRFVLDSEGAHFAVRVMAIRCFVNSMRYEPARFVMPKYFELLFDFVSSAKCLLDVQVHLQTAAAAFLANMSLYFHQCQCANEANDEQKHYFGEKLFDILLKNGEKLSVLDQLALFYVLQALVTFMWGDEKLIEIAGRKNLPPLLDKMKDLAHEERAKIIARSVEHMVR